MMCRKQRQNLRIVEGHAVTQRSTEILTTCRTLERFCESKDREKLFLSIR